MFRSVAKWIVGHRVRNELTLEATSDRSLKNNRVHQQRAMGKITEHVAWARQLGIRSIGTRNTLGKQRILSTGQTWREWRNNVEEVGHDEQKTRGVAREYNKGAVPQSNERTERALNKYWNGEQQQTWNMARNHRAQGTDRRDGESNSHVFAY